MPVNMQSRVVVPMFKKEDQREGSNIQGIPLLGLPRKDYDRLLERRLPPVVQPQIQEWQCRLHPGCRTMDQLFTLAKLLEESWEFGYLVSMAGS